MKDYHINIVYSNVILTVDLADEGLWAGDVGTVVDHHRTPGGVEGYSVEFFDMTGRTVAVATLRADQLRAPTSQDRPSVRILSPNGP